MTHQYLLPAEWDHQSGVMLTWPHKGTDWADMLEEVEKCFVEIAKAILIRQKLLIVCPDKNRVEAFFSPEFKTNLRTVEWAGNDTWARDHGAITIFENNQPVLLDFKFNGWGLKFASDKDNLITRQLFDQKCFSNQVIYQNQLGFVLEGGSIESDGRGTLLTTSNCLMSPNRNGHLNKGEIENYLKQTLGVEHILWLGNGYLAGDDTDSHIDTLARFCNTHTIAYVHCSDETDEHYDALKAMEQELKQLRTKEGTPYQLVALPMADAVYFNEHRLPATYANFLIINDAVLVPAYGSVKDVEVKMILKEVFPDREIVLIDCLPLIKQHGSLHCVTMQFPEGVIE